jgi:hypothetical protein
MRAKILFQVIAWTALALVSLPLDAGAMHRAGDGAYAFVSRGGAEGEELVDLIVRRPMQAAFDTTRAISWSALAEGIFWPFPGALPGGEAALTRYITVGNATFPSVEATLTVERVELPSDRRAGCEGYELSLAGEAVSLADDEARSGISGVSIDASGRAMVCDGDSLPVASEMVFERNTIYAPWFTGGFATPSVERIETAWAKIP